MPRPVEALPCGSRSTISTRSPIAASAVPRLIAVVVLPTPPFWLAMARTRGIGTEGDDLSGGSGTGTDGSDMRPRFGVSGAAAAANDQDASAQAGLTGNGGVLDSPIFS